MPSAAQDELPLEEIVPGYSSRMADWGGITVAFERAHAGQDASSMLAGLPGGRCQAPHWGYLFAGRIIVDYGDHRETIEGGEAYYVAPGHTLSFEADCEALEFTPTEALQETLDAARASHEAGAAPGA